MMKFATQRHIFPALVLGCMYLLLPLPIAAAEIVSVAEIRELQEILAQQDLQLSAQQELIDSQQEEIEKQRALLQSVQAQLDRLAAHQTVVSSTENAAQPQQPDALDNQDATEPESTSFGDDFTGSIPVGDSNPEFHEREVKVSARQSRLGIEIRDSTSYGPLRAFIEGDFAGINLLWSPAARVDVGGELLWGRRENLDGSYGTARQIQLGAKYRF